MFIVTFSDDEYYFPVYFQACCLLLLYKMLTYISILVFILLVENKISVEFRDKSINAIKELISVLTDKKHPNLQDNAEKRKCPFRVTYNFNHSHFLKICLDSDSFLQLSTSVSFVSSKVFPERPVSFSCRRKGWCWLKKKTYNLKVKNCVLSRFLLRTVVRDTSSKIVLWNYSKDIREELGYIGIFAGEKR